MATQEKTWNVANRLHSLKDSDNPEVNHIIAGADEIYDDAKGAKQSDINAQTDVALANRYTKSETYSKEQLDSLITTPDANYVTVATFADLPQTGEANTIYRVSFYDGTQVDASKYALYAWNGATYQLLAVRSAVGEVFDVSEYNSGATYETISAALAAVPASVQRGGMSIKFILRTNTGTEEEPVYHDEYVQYLLKKTAWSDTPSDWESIDGNNTIHINDAQQLTDAQKAQALANMGIGGIDDAPTANSDNLVRSGGVQNELALGAVYDVSAKNPTAGPNNDGKFESLSALLSDASLNTLIPTTVRKGGMSIKFVLSSDNKYVQYRLMSDTFNTTPANWQGVDDKPTDGSHNLVESGGVKSELNAIESQIKEVGISVESGAINYLNGHEIEDAKSVRSGFVVTNADKRLTINSTQKVIATLYVVFYLDGVHDGVNQTYLTQTINSKTATIAIPTSANYNQFRLRLSCPSDWTQTEIDGLYVSVTDSNGFVPAIDGIDTRIDGIDTRLNDRVKFVYANIGTDTQLAAANKAILGVYFTDNSNNFKLTTLYKNVNGTWMFSIWNEGITEQVFRYSSTTAPNDGLIKIYNSRYGTMYAVIDWDSLEDGFQMEGKTGATALLSNDCFNINSFPAILARINEVIASLKSTLNLSVVASVQNKYIKSDVNVGELFTLTYKNAADYKCVYFKVYKGDSIRLLTSKNTAMAAPWVITDKNSVVTYVEPYVSANYIHDEIITISQDGYIYINSGSVWGVTINDMVQNRVKNFNYDNPVYDSVSVSRYLIGEMYSDFRFDKVAAGIISPNMIALKKTFNIPDGVIIATDIDFYSTDATPDNEFIQKSVVPYLYFNSVKIGTIVLYDDATGKPYIFDRNGNKVMLAVENS